MAGFVKTVNDTALAQLSDTLPLSLAYTSVAMAADTLLAFTLVWLLRRARSGLRSSDSIVNRLVTYVMGTSLVTVLGMAISLIFSLVAIYSSINITANVIVPKCLSFCLEKCSPVTNKSPSVFQLSAGFVRHSRTPSSFAGTYEKLAGSMLGRKFAGISLSL